MTDDDLATLPTVVVARILEHMAIDTHILLITRAVVAVWAEAA